ncbi:MAG: dihydropteroate synthase [Oligosphaeraceae bacterium]|nr:dihydropteroate synthase [Oligosphaeraceae bacterium]
MPDTSKQLFNFRFKQQSMKLDGYPKLMGIINLTPDSFSDGGKYNSLEAALQQADNLEKQGADFLDLGGESTRPGYNAVSPDEEIRRVVPVVAELVKRTRLPISIDTTKALVAEAALEAGADIINDVSALSDPAMPEALRRHQAGCIIMHCQQLPPEDSAYAQVFDFLQERLKWAQSQTGLPAEYFVLDPGVGFGKTLSQNLSVIKHLAQLRRRGLPILLGVSNKSYIGKICDEQRPQARLPGSLATAAIAAYQQSCDIIRVHQVAETRQALMVAKAILDSV